MPIRDDGVREYLRGIARELDTAPRGGRGPIVSRATAFLGWSAPTLYRQLERQAGWTSGRRAREDRGATSQPHDGMELVAALQRESVRANGKVTMHVPTARSIAAVNGAQVTVSADRMQRLLRERHMHVGAQRQDRPAQEMRALHPNHVHQVDPSLCLLYYLRGQQAMIRDDEFYKNKLDAVAKIKLKVWRYVLYDAASATIVVRYYEAAGESQQTLFDFLMYAWARPADVSRRPFHGVPRILVWDKGSANGAAAIQTLLEALEVQPIAHAKGNPRAKGGVENANNLVETHFECRFKSDPVHSVEELNRAAEHWMNAFNADAVPDVDCRLHRFGLTHPIARYHLWKRITQSQLRELPPVEVCRSLMEGKPQPRKVAQGMRITFRHPAAARSFEYDLSGLAGVCVGDVVQVSPLVFGNLAVVVRVERFDGEPLVHRVEPITEFDEFGQPLTAAVWGQEWKAKPDTAVETAGKALDQRAYPGLPLADVKAARDKNEVPFGGTIDAHRHLAQVELPTFLASRGHAINVPDAAEAIERPLTHAQAAIQLQAMLGETWTRDAYAQMAREYPEGVPQGELARIAQALTGAQAPAATGTDGARFSVVK